MSQENVEVVRLVIEALNARDSGPVRNLFVAEGEWRPILTAGGDLERHVYRGPEGIEEYWTDLDDLFAETEIHVGSLDPVGRDCVLFSGHVTARGRTSGVPLDQPIWGLFEVRRGHLVRGTAYRSREEALQAVGLSE
jgi:hypothetical protein